MCCRALQIWNGVCVFQSLGFFFLSASTLHAYTKKKKHTKWTLPFILQFLGWVPVDINLHYYIFFFSVNSFCLEQVCVSINAWLVSSVVLFCCWFLTHADRPSKSECKARCSLWPRQQQMSFCNESIQPPFSVSSTCPRPPGCHWIP